MPRALRWVRWGAMSTFLAGLVLFTMIYMYTPGQGFGPSSLFMDTATGKMTDRAIWMLLGSILGTIMWFNVWFVIWPTQKSILSGKYTAEQLPDARKKALFFSRLNTYLSGPMLFGMLAPSHYGAINPVTALVAIGLGLVAIWHAIKFSPKVGTTV